MLRRGSQGSANCSELNLLWGRLRARHETSRTRCPAREDVKLPRGVRSKSASAAEAKARESVFGETRMKDEDVLFLFAESRSDLRRTSIPGPGGLGGLRKTFRRECQRCLAIAGAHSKLWVERVGWKATRSRPLERQVLNILDPAAHATPGLHDLASCPSEIDA